LHVERLSVGLGDTFQFVLLLDGETVAGALGGVHELVGEALSNGLDVSEGGVLGASCDEPDGLVDTSHWRDVASLSSDGTGSADSGGVFTWAAVHDGAHADLDWVLAGHDVDDFESVLDDSDAQELLTVVSALLHESAHQSLDDWALRLAESDLVVSSSAMRRVLGVALVEVDVISERHVLAADICQVPLAEELWLIRLFNFFFLSPFLLLSGDRLFFSPVFFSHFGYVFGVVCKGVFL